MEIKITRHPIKRTISIEIPAAAIVDLADVLDMADVEGAGWDAQEDALDLQTSLRGAIRKSLKY